MVRILLAVALVVVALTPPPVRAECRAYPVTADSPSGIAGCELYGEGIASRWQGPGVARNDCLWPWDACTPIIITSLDTGLSVVVTPTMFCDCYQRPGPNGETTRLVDLDYDTLTALGLSWTLGLYRVRVEPAQAISSIVLPDTRMSTE